MLLDGTETYPQPQITSISRVPFLQHALHATSGFEMCFGYFYLIFRYDGPNVKIGGIYYP